MYRIINLLVKLIGFKGQDKWGVKNDYKICRVNDQIEVSFNKMGRAEEKDNCENKSFVFSFDMFVLRYCEILNRNVE